MDRTGLEIIAAVKKGRVSDGECKTGRILQLEGSTAFENVQGVEREVPEGGFTAGNRSETAWWIFAALATSSTSSWPTPGLP